MKCGFERHAPHGLRKNATQQLLEAGCTYPQARSITGHKTKSMIDKYGKDAEKKILARAAFDKLEAFDVSEASDPLRPNDSSNKET